MQMAKFGKGKTAKFKGEKAILGQILAGWAKVKGNEAPKRQNKRTKRPKMKGKENEGPKGQYSTNKGPKGYKAWTTSTKQMVQTLGLSSTD